MRCHCDIHMKNNLTVKGSCFGAKTLCNEYRGVQIFQKSSSHLLILGARRVTCNKIHTEDPQFWIDLSTSVLSGALCSVYVN